MADLPPDMIQDLEAASRENIQVRGAEMISLADAVYQLWWRLSDFELFELSPVLPTFDPAVWVIPELIHGTQEKEFVYPIQDYGNRLLTSKQDELFLAGLSMCKMHYTIEKMIAILMERLKAGGVTEETEVQVAFDGHEIAQRKAFETVINLEYNMVVTNFDPGPWGEKYLSILKGLGEKGYGYPSKAPRDIYKHIRAHGMKPK